MVAKYSSRKLTYFSDKLVAIAGLAKIVGTSTAQDSGANHHHQVFFGRAIILNVTGLALSFTEHLLGRGLLLSKVWQLLVKMMISAKQ